MASSATIPEACDCEIDGEAGLDDLIMADREIALNAAEVPPPAVADKTGFFAETSGTAKADDESINKINSPKDFLNTAITCDSAITIINNTECSYCDCKEEDDDDAAAAGAAASAGGTGSASSSPPNAAVNYINSFSNNSGDLLENVPQWKRDLIQRRKTNIARTIGANQTASCPRKVSDSAQLLTSPVMPLTKTLPASGTSSSNTITNNTTISSSSTTTTTTTNSSRTTSLGSINTTSSSHSHSLNIVKMPALSHHHHHHHHQQQQQQQQQSQQHYGLSSGHYTPLNSSSQSLLPQTLSANNTSQDIQSSSLSSSVCNPTKLSRSSSSSIGSTTITNNQMIPSTEDEQEKEDVELEPLQSASKCNNSVGYTSGTCLATLHEQLPPHKPPQQQQQQQQQHQLIQPYSVELQQQQFQYHSRHDIVKSPSSSSSCSVASGVSSPSSLFVKNPSVNKTCKNNKYKVNNNNTKGITNPSVTQNSAGNLNNTTIAANTGKKMVAAQDISDATNNIDFDFDPSEELQYGPGIVSKLRCRYLSLALRQSSNKQRPPLDSLRRATSLNNLLDDDEDSNSSCVVEHIEHHNHGQKIIWNTATGTTQTINTTNSITHNNNNNNTAPHTPDEFVATFQKNLKLSDRDKRSRQIKRGNDSLKRARSVEALLVCDKTWGSDIESSTNGVLLPIRQIISSKKSNLHKDSSSFTNTNTTIDNNVTNTYTLSSGLDTCLTSATAEITIEDKISNARERIQINDKPPKRLTSIIDDTERPPPDVVKQTLKIFEASANRRGRGLSRNNFSGEVAAKVANYKSIISQEKPPIVFPKPPLSPKKHYRKPGTLDIVTGSSGGGGGGMKKSNQQTIINANSKKSLTSHPTSPVSNIGKKFTALDVSSTESYEYQTPPHSQSSSPTITGSGGGGHRSDNNITFRNSMKHDSTGVVVTTTSLTSSSSSSSSSSSRNTFDINNSPRTPDIIPRKHFDLMTTTTTTTPTTAINVDSSSSITQLAKRLERMTIESPQSNTSTPTQQQQQQQRQRKSSESDDSIDSSGDNLTKQFSKSSLENISNAGTNQHYSFNKSSSKPTMMAVINSSNSNNLNGNSLLNSGGGSCSSDQQQQYQALNLANTTIATVVTPKQVGVIRPLVSEPKFQMTENSNLSDLNFSLDDISAKNRDNLVITSLNQTNTTNSSNRDRGAAVVVAPPPLQSSEKPALTSREIEKNLINEKKNEQANLESGGVKWQLGKKKPWSSQMAPSQNNCMVFNFKDRKEVPDYIESDGIIFKRRRELPKPNEPGFVLLGDLSLETSTDSDDSWTMGPPSPCDVEFENANIIIDGKSSIRYRSKDISLRVQFDDTLTSTFEYPSESSLIDDSISSDNSNNKDSTDHITVEEIIQIPSPKLLGTVSLGSAPLSSYTPVKAPLNTNFELGVTRTLTPTESPPPPPPIESSTIEEKSTALNANGTSSKCEKQFLLSTNTCGDQLEGSDPVQNGNVTEMDSLTYLKPATDDLTVVYSEGADKADLLY